MIRQWEPIDFQWTGRTKPGCVWFRRVTLHECVVTEYDRRRPNDERSVTRWLVRSLEYGKGKSGGNAR